MGKVYVLRKNEGGGFSPNVAVGPGGPSFILGTSSEDVDYGKYDEMGAGAGKYARRLGGLGRAGRILGAGLGGLRSFYDATSSGQPGALTAAAGGGFSGYYGTQGLEQFAADAGSRYGQYRDARDAGRDRARQESMADYTQGATPTNPDATFDSSMFNPVEQQQRAMDNLSRQWQNTGGLYGGNITPTITPKLGHGAQDGSGSTIGQQFSAAAPQPTNAQPSTTQSKITDYPPTHPLITSLKEFEQETEGGGSTTQGG
tara:strand:- start:1088 stop:1861 length:774 start_codon:yes stop_codon:yes gene_type:complete